MTKSKHNVGRKQKNDTDALIYSYLDALLGEPLKHNNSVLSEGQKNHVSVSGEARPAILCASVADGHWLIPTIKLFPADATKKIRSREESMLILLNNLYFLRRPLSARVRQCFLDLSEQMLEDYLVAAWDKQQISRAGILCDS